jgi:hypothetical protein
VCLEVRENYPRALAPIASAGISHLGGNDRDCVPNQSTCQNCYSELICVGLPSGEIFDDGVYHCADQDPRPRTATTACAAPRPPKDASCHSDAVKTDSFRIMTTARSFTSASVIQPLLTFAPTTMCAVIRKGYVSPETPITISQSSNTNDVSVGVRRLSQVSQRLWSLYTWPAIPNVQMQSRRAVRRQPVKMSVRLLTRRYVSSRQVWQLLRVYFCRYK